MLIAGAAVAGGCRSSATPTRSGDSARFVTESVPWDTATVGADGRTVTVSYPVACTDAYGVAFTEKAGQAVATVLVQEPAGEHGCQSMPVGERRFITAVAPRPVGSKPVLHGPLGTVAHPAITAPAMPHPTTSVLSGSR